MSMKLLTYGVIIVATLFYVGEAIYLLGYVDGSMDTWKKR